MSDTALVLSVDHYTITDAKTGEIQELYQVWMASDYREATNTEKGCKPVKMLTTAEIFGELMNHPLPSVFDIDVKVRPGKANALSAMISGFKFLSTPKIFPVVAVAKAA